VQLGQRILINDGLVELVVTALDATQVIRPCPARRANLFEEGDELPRLGADHPAITEKDKIDVKFSVEQQLDYIAASFVRRRSDIVHLRELLASTAAARSTSSQAPRNRKPSTTSRTSLPSAMGVMVARGDLGVSSSASGADHGRRRSSPRPAGGGGSPSPPPRCSSR